VLVHSRNSEELVWLGSSMSGGMEEPRSQSSGQGEAVDA
jgi:hypothetical protein